MITVRILRSTDVAVYMKLVRTVIASTPIYSAKARAIEIKRTAVLIRKRDTEHWFLVALDAGNQVGFAFGDAFGGVTWIDWIGVDPAHRREGIAEALMKAMVQFLKRRGVRKVWFDTRTANRASIPFVRKLGCRKIGIVRNHWHGHDYYLWEKVL